MGLAVALGFKMGLFNIGADGQYRIGALLAAAAGPRSSLPAPLHVLFIVLVAMVGAGAYAGIAGVLKVTRGVNEVVSTIMLNFIATGITAYLLSVYLRNKAVELPVGDASPSRRSGWLPSLNRAAELDRLPPRARHDPAGLPASSPPSPASASTSSSTAPASASTCGPRAPTPAAALASGVNPNAMIMKTIILSGRSPASPGWAPLLSELHKYGDTFPTALGFTGIAVALLGRNHPAGIAVAALVLAGIEQAARALAGGRHPTGDRQDPAGHPAAVRRHRLRGRAPLRPGRGGAGRRRAGPTPSIASGPTRGGDVMTARRPPATAARPAAWSASSTTAHPTSGPSSSRSAGWPCCRSCASSPARPTSPRATPSSPPSAPCRRSCSPPSAACSPSGSASSTSASRA